jgi:drug/metabolite transporter (DMT)-like permease
LSLPIFAALLAAALLHAMWNALVRRDPDRTAAATAIAAGGGVVGVILLPLLPAMNLAAAPFALSTSFIHVAYFALIGRTYRHGELSVSYPIMRGLAPLLVTAVAAVFIETPALIVVIGIVVVTVGIVSLSVDGLRRGSRGIGAAVANAGVIAVYTLVDGLGARASGAPATYVAWILVGAAITTVGWRCFLRGRVVIAELLPRALMGVGGGAMSYAAYGIALWAMTFTPIGAVAAVRESSVLFATAIGSLALGERFGLGRWLAAVLVVIGLALVKFGGAG